MAITRRIIMAKAIITRSQVFAIYFFFLLLLAFFFGFGAGHGGQTCLVVICFSAAAPTRPEKNAQEIIPIKYATCFSAGSFITRKKPDMIMNAISDSEKYR